METLGGYGYLVFGVSNDGGVVGIGNISGDPPSELRRIVNGHLERPVNFEYITCEVDDKAGGKKRVAAIVVPDCRRRPHMASREIKERRNATYPQWSYGDDTRRFWRDYNRIRKTVAIGPPYKP